MKHGTGVFCVAFVTSLFGLGCGDALPEEDVAQSREAINVSTWAQLTAMGSTGSYTLTADIDATGKTWTPKTFSGTFDGGNRTISNLTISNGSFFSGLTNATIRNVRFTNLTITGGSWGPLGGLAGSASNSTIQNSAVEANINVNAIYVGGLVGSMVGGSIYRSYAKGTISGVISNSGGLVGGATEGTNGASIVESYAQVTVNPDGGSAGTTVTAGGIVGYSYGIDIHDVYAVGNVTGRGAVGGIAGVLDCTPDESIFLLYKTIYRGDVVDKNWSSSGGWAGPVGLWTDCTSRFTQNFYDRTLDPSSNYVVHNDAVSRYTTSELRSPTSVVGGVFCNGVAPVCGDNTWAAPPWTAGTSSQHHVLQNMPGPNSQPR